MHHHKAPVILAVSGLAAISLIWITHVSAGTLFAWMVNGVVFGIPAVVSAAFFILLAAVLIHNLAMPHHH